MAKKQRKNDIGQRELLRDIVVAFARASERSPVMASFVATFPHYLAMYLDGKNTITHNAVDARAHIFQVANLRATNARLTTPLFEFGVGERGARGGGTPRLEGLVSLLEHLQK